MRFKFSLAVALATAAAIGLSIAQAQGPTSGTIVLKVPADATVIISGAKTTQKGPVRTFYTPDLAAGWKYQYEVTVEWKDGGAAKKKTEWVDVTPGKTTNLEWAMTGAGKKDDVKKDEVKKDVKKDDIKKDDVKKDDFKKDVKKDDVKKDVKKDDVKKDDVKKDDVKKDDVKKDDFKKDVKKDDVKKDDVKKDEVKKDVKKDDVKKDDVKKDDFKKDVKKDDVKKDDVKKDDVKKDEGKKAEFKVDDKGFTKIFNNTNLDGLKTNVFGKKDGKNPFEVKEGVIHVAGSPNGYFYTEKSYKNYILRFDWKFLKDGNSGLLVHIQSHGGGWPKSIEVQGQQRDHGNIFALGAKGDFKKNAAAQKEAIKIGEWNTTEVVSQNGKLTALVNGIEVSTGQSELTEGPIGWQSEGAPLQFKNIRIRVMD